MHEVWSSPFHEWWTHLLLGVVGLGICVGAVASLRREQEPKWLLFFSFGAFCLYLAYPRKIDRPRYDRPLLLAALRADGIAMEWPVRRTIPYDMVRKAWANSRRRNTYMVIVIDTAAPRGREFGKVKLRWDSDADAAPFIALLERRVAVPVAVHGLWLNHLVSREHDRLSAASRQRGER